MGLGLPDGGHLTHGYYVCTDLYMVAHINLLTSSADGQEENDGFVHILPVFPLRT